MKSPIRFDPRSFSLALALVAITLVLQSPVDAQTLGDSLRGIFGETMKEVGKIRDRTTAGRNGGQTSTGADEIKLSRAQRREVQEALNQRGYQAGSPDGMFGKNTRRAIAAYQADEGREGTGYLVQADVDDLDISQQSAGGRAESGGTESVPRELVKPPADVNKIVASKSDPANAAQYISETYGIPLLDGHLVMTDARFSGDQDESFGLPQKSLDYRWQRFLVLNHYLSIEPTEKDTAALINRVLTTEQRKQVVTKVLKDDPAVAAGDPKAIQNALSFKLNEFQRRELYSHVKSEFVPENFPISTFKSFDVVLIRSAALGAYDFDKGEMKISISNNLYFPSLYIERGQTQYSNNDKVKLPFRRKAKTIKVAEETARQIDKYDRDKRNNAKDPMAGFGMVSRQSFLGIFGELTIDTASKPVYALEAENLRWTYDLGLTEPIQEVALATIFPSTGDAPETFADRQFEILGVKLGMSIDEARQVVVKELGKAKVEELETSRLNAAKGATGCSIARSKLQRAHKKAHQESGKSGSVVALSEEELASGMPAQCSAHFRVFTAAAGWKVTYGPTLSENIFLFVSRHPDFKGKVVAMTRTMDDKNNVINIQREIAKKFGDNYLQRMKSEGFWYGTSRIQNRVKQDKKMLARCSGNDWPVVDRGGRIEAGAFRAKCGDILITDAGQRSPKLLMVNTDYVQEINDRVVLAKRKQKQQRVEKSREQATTVKF